MKFLQSTILSLFAVSLAAVDVKLGMMERQSDFRVTQADCTGWDTANSKCWQGDNWKAVMLPGLMALKHFNDRNPTYVAEFGNLGSCDKQLVPTIVDSGSVGSTSTKALLSLLTGGSTPDIIVGPARSAATMPSALITGIYDIPQVSYWATSGKLDDTAEYSRFMRTIPTDDAVAFSICKYWVSQGYKHTAMLYANEPYGSAYKESIVKHCTDAGINVASFAFSPGDAASIKAQLKQLEDASVNVIMAVTSGSDYQIIFSEAQALQIMGKGKMWVFADGASASDFNAAAGATRNALHGSIRILAAGGSDSNAAYTKFKSDWTGFDVTDWNNQYPAEWQLPTDFFTAENFEAFSGDIRDIGTYQYDAVAAMGIAACKVQATGALPDGFGSKIWEAKSDLDFTGLSGNVKLDSIGNRDPTTANYVMANVMLDVDGVATFKTIAKYNNANSKWDFEANTEVIYNGGATELPSDITVPAHNMNYASDTTKTGVIVFALMSCIMAIGLTVWTSINWKAKIVRHSQGPFLLMLIFGCIVSSSSIFFFSFDDKPAADGTVTDQAVLDFACQASVWTYSIGFIVTFAALFAKTYRAYKIFSNKKMKRVTVTTADMILPIVVLLIIDGALLMWWSASNPLVYKRVIEHFDVYGNPVSSNAGCQLSNPSDDIYLYIAPIAVIHGLMLIIGNVLAYLARSIPGSFQESKYIAVSMVSTLQIFIIGLPVLIIVANNAEASLFIRSAIIFLNDFGVLCLIFLPKVLAVHGCITIGNMDANSTSKTTVMKTTSGGSRSDSENSAGSSSTASSTATSEV